STTLFRSSLRQIYGRPFTETRRALSDVANPLRAPLRGLTCTSQKLSKGGPRAVYLVGSSMLTLESWLRHLANPLRRIFQLQKLFFFTLHSVYFSVTFKNSKQKKSNKQLLCTNTTIYGVLSGIFFFELLCNTHHRRSTVNVDE